MTPYWHLAMSALGVYGFLVDSDTHLALAIVGTTTCLISTLLTRTYR